MAINGIGSLNNMYSIQNNYNDYRLQMALSKRGLSGTNNTSAGTSTSTGTNAAVSGSVNFLKQYNTVMSDLLSSANALSATNTSGVMNDLSVSSSNTDIAQASIQYKTRTSTAKDLTVDVQQLAQAQQNTSNEVMGSASASGNMDLRIETAKGGVINVNVNALYDDGTTKTNRQMLREAAQQINSANGSVSAKVVENDGKVSLQITGKETGLQNSFTVSGEAGAAQGIDKEGTRAQNAQYTVTENGVTKSYASDTNSVGIDLGRIGLQLKDTGTVKISTAPDTKKIVSAVKNLADSYNNAIEFLGENSGRGSGVERQLRNLLMGIAPEKSLDLLGITTNSDGTLKVNEDTLTKKLNEDPTLSRDIISGANGMASRAYGKAERAMATNSVSLINNDLRSAEQDSITNEYNFMNMFARSGAYNMNNYYALGMMVNYLA